MFKRRDRPRPLERLRAVLWPRGGWPRAARYAAHRIRRIPDTPHRIALGFACGVVVSFNPFFGTHFFLAAAVAWAVRANLLAALVGTLVGNPLTFPLIAAVALPLGRRILGRSATTREADLAEDAALDVADEAGGLIGEAASAVGDGRADWGRLAAFAEDVLLPYSVGGLAPGLLAATAAYWLVRPLTAAYQARRRARLEARARRGG